MFTKRTRDILTHVFFLTLFLIVPVLSFVRRPGEPLFYIDRVFVQDTTANFVLLCFFYLNYYILIPRLFFRRQYAGYVISVLLFLALAFMLPYLAGRLLPNPGHHEPFDLGTRPHPSGQHSLITFMVDEFRRHVFLFFTAVFFSFLLRTREHLIRLREEKLQAELSSLKSQINPHFLFNTLNSIYTLSVKKDDRASAAIIHLSGLMRYVIKEANHYSIPLQKEMEYIENYVELQKARLAHTARVDFAYTGRPGSLEIAPLLLITYIENAFKYGVNPEADDCIIEIKLTVTDQELQLYVFNRKVKPPARVESSGIGLNNTRERLKHLYAGRHMLEIAEDRETYIIKLSIQLA